MDGTAGVEWGVGSWVSNTQQLLGKSMSFCIFWPGLKSQEKGWCSAREVVERQLIRIMSGGVSSAAIVCLQDRLSSIQCLTLSWFLYKNECCRLCRSSATLLHDIRISYPLCALPPPQLVSKNPACHAQRPPRTHLYISTPSFSTPSNPFHPIPPTPSKNHPRPISPPHLSHPPAPASTSNPTPTTPLPTSFAPSKTTKSASPTKPLPLCIYAFSASNAAPNTPYVT